MTGFWWERALGSHRSSPGLRKAAVGIGPRPMTWHALDAKKPHERYRVEVGADGVIVAGLGGTRQFALSAATVGVAKWIAQRPGAALVLGEGSEQFVIGSQGAHYSYENRPPCSKVDAVMAEREFHGLMAALQSAWRTAHPPAQGYRASSREPRMFQQFFPLHRGSGVVTVAAILFAFVAFMAASLWLPTGSTAWLAGSAFLGMALIWLATTWQLMRPRYRLEFSGEMLRLCNKQRVIVEARRADVPIRFDEARGSVRLEFPDGRGWDLHRLPSPKRNWFPLGFFPSRRELLLEPEAIPLLRAACEPAEVTPSAQGKSTRVRVRTEQDELDGRHEEPLRAKVRD